MSPHPLWCSRYGEPADACGRYHSSRVTEIPATGGRLHGYVTVVAGHPHGEPPMVQLETTDTDALGGPVDLTLEQAEEVAARLVAAVVALRAGGRLRPRRVDWTADDPDERTCAYPGDHEHDHEMCRDAVLDHADHMVTGRWTAVIR